jgi:KRAB domain-containing zinc finger protein
LPPRASEITCAECGTSVSGTRGLVRHVESMHPRSRSARDGSGKLLCPLCYAALGNEQALRYHLYKHAQLRPYRCTACRAAFRTPSTLAAHMHVRHSAAPSGASRQHVCSVCGIRASTSGKLKIHQEIHAAEKLYQCAVCAERFRQQSVLRVHEFIHTKQSAHRCGQCGRCFATKGLLGKYFSQICESEFVPILIHRYSFELL